MDEGGGENHAVNECRIRILQNDPKKMVTEDKMGKYIQTGREKNIYNHTDNSRW